MADEEVVVSPEGAEGETVEEQPGGAAETGTTEQPEGNEAEGEHTETPPEPKKKTAQERIDEITKARREAEREAKYWRDLALKSEQAAPQQPVAQPTNLPPRPKLEQFETTDAYEDALFEWRDRVTFIKGEESRRASQQEAAVRSFQDRAKSLREEYDDFDEVIEQPVFSPIMRTAILHSENGPLVAYHLGKPENRETARKIMALPLELQPYEIAKLETQIVLAKKTKKVTDAPPPIKPVGMSGGGKEKDPADMSTAEWMAWDRARTQERLKKKYGG